MTESDNQEANKPIDDVKQSFAWGQLFTGSLIGGLAVWKLLHKMTNTEPSEWFAGLSSAYEEVRDFLFSPLDWIRIDFTANERNLIVFTMLVLGAVLRTARNFPLLAVLLVGTLAGSLGQSWYANTLPNDWVSWAAGITLGFGVIGPAIALYTERHEYRLRMSKFLLLSIVFTLAWGALLLLLNWATS